MKDPVVTGQTDVPYLPLIDFRPFLTGTEPEKQIIAENITTGFKTTGFIYLKNFGIPTHVIREVFAQSASFFCIPQAHKDALAVPGPESNRGYGSTGREKLIRSLDDKSVAAALRTHNPDLKETFQMGKNDPKNEMNQWPDDPRFKVVMEDFFERGRVLHMQIMKAVALGLSLDGNFFDEFIDEGDNWLRLLHYPAVSKSVFKSNHEQVRAGAHSDYGDLTLLFQDNSSGLQVQSSSGVFIDAKPIPDTVIVNAGDLLERWSNDIIKSTIHRVVKPSMEADVEEFPARFSVAYFCQPNLKAVIKSIPGTTADGTSKYPAISSGDYLLRRLRATY